MAVTDLKVRSEPWEGDIVRIHMRGGLSASSAEVLEKEIMRWFSKSVRTFTVGMEDISELTASGAAALTALARRVQDDGGRVVLINPSAAAYRTLDLLGLLSFYPIVSSLQEVVSRIVAVKKPGAARPRERTPLGVPSARAPANPQDVAPAGDSAAAPPAGAPPL